jgi:hypothetical protein
MRLAVCTRAVLVVLALESVSGCARRRTVIEEFGTTKFGMRGLDIRLAAGVSDGHVLNREGPNGAVATSGGTTVTIKGENMHLTVNGLPYSTVEKGDRVFVEKDKVSVNGEVRQPKEPAKEN